MIVIPGADGVGGDVDFSMPLGKMLLSSGTISTFDGNCQSLRKVDKEMMLLQLIHLLGNQDDFKLAQPLSGLKLLVIQGAQTSVIIASSKNSEPITHEQLIRPISGFR